VCTENCACFCEVRGTPFYSMPYTSMVLKMVIHRCLEGPMSSLELQEELLMTFATLRKLLLLEALVFLKASKNPLLTVNGYWSDWARVTPCDATCGSGTQTRFRLCHPPVGAGSTCQGPMSDVVSCSIRPCPGESTFSVYSAPFGPKAM